MTPTIKFSTAAVLIVALLTFSCGGSATAPSPLIAALEAISIAADVGAPVIATLNPAAASFVNLVPGVITAAIDVVEGTSPLATASTVTTQLQQIWQQGEALLPNLSGTDKTVITGILAALQAGLQLYQQQFPPTTAAFERMIHNGYARGFFDTPTPATAKLKPMKLSKADKASIARAKAHIAAVHTQLSTRKVR
jgi:hypothetical protein